VDHFDRIFALHRILTNRRTPVSRLDLQRQLECSRATVGRLIESMRDKLGAPVVYDRECNGYRYDRGADASWELPGLWFNASELHALMVSARLLANVQPGILDSALEPLRERIDQLLRHRRAGHPDVERRVRILQIAARSTDLDNFRMISTALLQRRTLHILYHGRARDKNTERDVSPQRLVYYRDNWYLDAWCHWRKGLRSFALDRLHPVRIEDSAARDVPDEQLDAHYTAAYGIFAGPADKTAVLRFSGAAAKWVADEHWHPRQDGKTLKSGQYELRIPYGNPTELIMDILKHGEHVEVLAPAALRREVARRLRAAAGQYRNVIAADAANDDSALRRR
jgi:predicted DNA-binding transcriptional regulator YafY